MGPLLGSRSVPLRWCLHALNHCLVSCACRCLGAADLKRRVFTSQNLDNAESRMYSKQQPLTRLDCFQMECRVNEQGEQDVWLVLGIDSPAVR